LRDDPPGRDKPARVGRQRSGALFRGIGVEEISEPKMRYR
jgi:hypothetical protein